MTDDEYLKILRQNDPDPSSEVWKIFISIVLGWVGLVCIVWLFQ